MKWAIGGAVLAALGWGAKKARDKWRDIRRGWWM